MPPLDDRCRVLDTSQSNGREAAKRHARSRIGRRQHVRDRHGIFPSACRALHPGASRRRRWQPNRGECAKCHPVREKTYTVKDAGNVLFSHKFHTGMYSCAECHPRLYLPGKGNVAVSMAGMETQKSCGACHAASLRSRSKRTAKNVIRWGKTSGW